ncbi:agmatine deiminase [Arthrobacter pigmenti]|uniref:Agmatine deiminase n=1 Tax=Arthrobacter pigmenti TaxID=271432 RepID=A0A846RX61_9MICC|nr:agmatine deiminase family protein [Arthrobacter pigmenti]NJC24175.1 agmatine deiminase [Arthrobacter pigmenti]
MPAETAPHERTWMAFPPSESSLGSSREEISEARDAWCAVAHAVAEFEPVTMLADPADVEDARARLSREIEIIDAPLNDAWMRDIGPTFVSNGTETGAVDWVFNGWGAQGWAAWEKDQHIGARVAELAGVRRIVSSLVNEGGGFHYDGEGTVLLTGSVQLDPGRNPGLTRTDVEAEFSRTIGADRAIWLPRGLTRDYERYGTRGHVDMTAVMPAPGTVLVHTQKDPDHPDHAVSRELMEHLSALEVLELPAPQVLRDDEGWVDYSYVNHYVVNGGVIAAHPNRGCRSWGLKPPVSSRLRAM